MIVLSKIRGLICYPVNTKNALPSQSLEHMLCYTFANCKSYLSFLGNRCPGGSYTYVDNWLKELGKKSLTYP